MDITKTQTLSYAAILFTGMFFGWLIFGGSPDHNGHDHSHEQTQLSETDGEIWTCSMHPSVREDGPGSCPICGMDLIPASADERENDFSMVMTEAAIQLANIQTTPVIRDLPKRDLRLPGRISIDERQISYVTAHFDGRIRNMQIDHTGAPIRKGEVMATVYSPDLVSAQRELLEAAGMKERNPALYDAAVRKFRQWEFTDEQIEGILERGEIQQELEILSPVDGYVAARNVLPEQHVTEGTVLYEVAKLEQLWVILEAYEEDIDWISPGDSLAFQTRSRPGHTYEAVVNYIDPVVDPEKRTIRVRADIENHDLRLRPDMLVAGTLTLEQPEEKRMVPAPAVLWTGPRSLVYVKDRSADVPRFEAREVELGSRAGDYYIIESGVEAGEEVVFNGTFRVDSEFQLADRFSMTNRRPGTGAIPAGHHHGGHSEHEEREGHTDDAEDPHSRHEGHNHETENFSEDVSDDFRAEFTEMVLVYLELKDALIESDFDEASRLSFSLKNELEEIGEHRNQGDAHIAWMEQYSGLMEHLHPMTGAGTLEEIRTHFRYLSDRMVQSVNLFGIEKVVYHQYCPMAFGNEGADWLSSEEQIRNPYLPETMLTCGEIIGRIEDGD